MHNLKNLTSLSRWCACNYLSQVWAYAMWKGLETSSLSVLCGTALLRKPVPGLSWWLSFYSCAWCCTEGKVPGAYAWGTFKKSLTYNGISKAAAELRSQQNCLHMKKLNPWMYLMAHIWLTCKFYSCQCRYQLEQSWLSAFRINIS